MRRRPFEGQTWRTDVTFERLRIMMWLPSEIQDSPCHCCPWVGCQWLLQYRPGPPWSRMCQGSGSAKACAFFTSTSREVSALPDIFVAIPAVSEGVEHVQLIWEGGCDYTFPKTVTCRQGIPTLYPCTVKHVRLKIEVSVSLLQPQPLQSHPK